MGKKFTFAYSLVIGTMVALFLSMAVTYAEGACIEDTYINVYTIQWTSKKFVWHALSSDTNNGYADKLAMSGRISEGVKYANIDKSNLKPLDKFEIIPTDAKADVDNNIDVYLDTSTDKYSIVITDKKKDKVDYYVMGTESFSNKFMGKSKLTTSNVIVKIPVDESDLDKLHEGARYRTTVDGDGNKKIVFDK